MGIAIPEVNLPVDVHDNDVCFIHTDMAPTKEHNGGSVDDLWTTCCENRHTSKDTHVVH
jgi:hypothetical protein